MGRHSAPDDDVAVAAAPSTQVAPAADVPGRHHSAEDGAPPQPRADLGAHADLRLLRASPGLRARCAAALVVPFALYTAALAVLGRADLYLLWVWIPTVTAGVVVGTFLDIAHRRDRPPTVE